jgi:serine protease AprX
MGPSGGVDSGAMAKPRVRQLVITFLAVAVLGTAAPAASPSPAPQSVIVVGRGAATAVAAVGGKVSLTLDTIGGVAATVPSAQVPTLQADGLIVTADVKAHVVSEGYPAAPSQSGSGQGVSAPTKLAPVLDAQMAALDPPATWGANTGDGIGVALIDTGVDSSAALAGHLVKSPDFSGEGDGIDHYGHGTFMAGLIAGAGPEHAGIAPGATVVSVKVAGADGSTSLSRVIAGIGWAVVHQDDYHIAVLSLSLGVDASGSYLNDPLSAAVEAAWASGLTVVVAAGNSGPGNVTSPGWDPYVLTVGAADNTSSVNPATATVPSWSSSATFAGFAKPDVLAPGVSVISLRAPGSTIDSKYPAARIGDRYFRGSGTSMATAITAGLAAAVTALHPNATPDDVKGALVSTARAVRSAPAKGREADLAAALSANGSASWEQSFPTALPHLVFAWQNGPWQGSRWQGSRWQGSRWQGSRWQGDSWVLWSALTDWMGSRWQGSRWQGSRWQGDGWTVDVGGPALP